MGNQSTLDALLKKGGGSLRRVKIDLLFMRVGFSRRGNIHGLVSSFKCGRLCLQGASEGFQKKMLTSSFFFQFISLAIVSHLQFAKNIQFCTLDVCYMHVIYPKPKIKNYLGGFLFPTHFPPFFQKPFL